MVFGSLLRPQDEVLAQTGSTISQHVFYIFLHSDPFSHSGRHDTPLYGLPSIPSSDEKLAELAQLLPRFTIGSGASL